MLKALDILLCVGVPDTAGILQCGSDQGLVGTLFAYPGASLDIPSQESKSPVGPSSDLVDVMAPGQVLVQVHSKISCCVYRAQVIPTECICRAWDP